jgi:hypothetical protein
MQLMQLYKQLKLARNSPLKIKELKAIREKGYIINKVKVLFQVE